MHRSIKRWENIWSDQAISAKSFIDTVGGHQVCRCLVSHSWGWDCKQMATQGPGQSQGLWSDLSIMSSGLRVFIQLWPRIRGEVQAVQAVTQLFVRKWISISEQCWRPVMPVIRGGSDNSFRLQVIRDKQEKTRQNKRKIRIYIYLPSYM